MMHDMGGWFWGPGYGHVMFGQIFWLIVLILALAFLVFALSSRK